LAKRRQAGALESEALALLWAAKEPLCPAQVLEQLPGDLAYTTVATILSRLVAKGLVQRVPRGRAWAYRPADDRSGYTAMQMRRLLEQDADVGAVLARFVDDLDPSEEQVLRSLLDSHSSGGG
jgi:predicted transcriptional regulator